jgi:hypothetical protein
VRLAVSAVVLPRCEAHSTAVSVLLLLLPLVLLPSVACQVLAQDPAKAAASYVLPMPKWEGRESALLKRLAVSCDCCCSCE